MQHFFSNQHLLYFDDDLSVSVLGCDVTCLRVSPSPIDKIEEETSYCHMTLLDVSALAAFKE